ncbi:amidohydrolase family protein [Gracilimonas sp.]|uniref:amidohydrolase family protein n=1 Tax=Gracilimonas sp. TaxID=1974203 RepID=UPI0032ED0893
MNTITTTKWAKIPFFLFLGLFTVQSVHASIFEVRQDTTEADTTVIPKADNELPMKPGRIIEFNTTEGTWMSLDISPDGQHIVFDLMGDIYRIPASGGEAEQLTDGMAFDTHPRYSPDGKYVLFTSDASGEEDLYYVDVADTSEITQITKGGNTRYTNADWTPDGEYVIASKGGLTPKLWLIHKEGGSGTALIGEPNGLKIIDPAISPDGRYVYFSQRNGAWNYNAQLPQYQIARYDREDGSRQTVTSRYGSAFTPTLSPDGKWMVYGSRYEDKTGLVIRDLKTGDERWLAYPVQRDDQESIATMGVLPAMTFTPDNKNLITSYGGKIYSINIESGESKEIPFEVNADLEMGPEVFFKYPVDDSKEMIATQIRDAEPSPNGKQLAFTVLDKLYIQDLPDGEPKRITNSDLIEAQPTWSPDGSWIVYATYDMEDGGALYKVNPNARRIRAEKITNDPGIYSEPAWSKSQNRIVALKGDNRSYDHSTGPFAFGSTEDLVWVSADGGSSNFIAKSNGRSNPHFVKSNDRIYLNRGNGTLLSVRWDGTDEKEHVRITGITTAGFNSMGENYASPEMLHPEEAAKENNPPSNASMVTMAPEGDQAMALINNDIYVVTVPKVGGDTPRISVASAASAAFPSKKLTSIGGQFPHWSNDASKVHWSIGKGHFIYDLNAAEAYEDSVEAAKKAEAEKKKEEEQMKKDDDSDDGDDSGDADEEADEEEPEEEKEEKKEDEGYKPEELSIEVSITRDIPEGTILLQNARIITMNGDEVIENGDVLIENNRIVEVGTNLTAPSGAETRDLSGKTIVPGFVDTHAHLWASWGIHKQRFWGYAANLAYGVTTTRDPQTATTDVLTYSDMVETGMMEGPRVYSTGPGLGFWAYNIQSLEHAKDVMKQYSKYYNTKTIKMYLAGNRQQRQWILMAAKEQSIMPTTEGALDWKLNMTQLIDGYPGHEHSLPIYPIYKDVITTTAEAKMAVTPTLLVSYGGPWAENYFYSRENPFFDEKLRTFTPYEELASKSRRRPGWFHDDEHVFQKHAEFQKDLKEAGGLSGVGSHGQLQGLGFHWELWAMATGGMNNHDALQVATIDGATAIGLDGDIGSIEAGKLADLIILNANPLDDLRNTNSIEWVMKNGRLYDGDTLDQLYPMQVKAAPYEWEFPNPTQMMLPGKE